MPLALTIDELADAWVLAVQGDLDYSECGAFRISIDRVLRAMPPRLVVDFAGVGYLDSSGLGLLLSLARGYADRGGRLVLVTNETVDSVLEMTRLAGAFTIEADAPSALEYLKRTEPPSDGGSG